MEFDTHIKKRAGRPKNIDSNSKTTTFRHNKIHNVIVESAMDEHNLGKSEMLRHIIIEWNMLRYRGDK